MRPSVVVGFVDDAQVDNRTECRTVAATCEYSVMVTGSCQGKLLRLVPVCVVKGEEERFGAAFERIGTCSVNIIRG